MVPRTMCSYLCNLRFTFHFDSAAAGTNWYLFLFASVNGTKMCDRGRGPQRDTSQLQKGEQGAGQCRKRGLKDNRHMMSMGNWTARELNAFNCAHLKDAVNPKKQFKFPILPPAEDTHTHRASTFRVWNKLTFLYLSLRLVNYFSKSLESQVQSQRETTLQSVCAAIKKYLGSFRA